MAETGFIIPLNLNDYLGSGQRNNRCGTRRGGLMRTSNLAAPKGHNPAKYFGVYDVVRLDTIWLDKS